MLENREKRNLIILLYTVLVLNGASPAGSVAIQLAMMGGVKVLTTAASTEELLYLQSFQPSIGITIYILYKFKTF